MCLDTETINIGGSGFIKGQLKEIEIRFDPCFPTEKQSCATDREFIQWFDNKEFYMWTTGNYLDPMGSVDEKESLKQRIVYQLALGTTLGIHSQVYFEMNMEEVKVKHEGDLAFGYNKPEPQVVQRFLNS